MIFSIGAMLSVEFIKTRHFDELKKIQDDSLETNGWKFCLVYLGLSILGEYIPILAQVGCIQMSIMGNWNELLQAELIMPDDVVTINSHMFASMMEK